MKKAVFLDRDDTVMRNVPYLGDPRQVEVFPCAQEALDLLQEAGYLLFLVSNQSGVGRGLISKEQVAAVNAEMERQLDSVYFEGIYNCYETPEDPKSATRRKPAPGMLLDAAKQVGLDLENSFMVGDRLSDVECGRNAGCRSVLVLTGTCSPEEEVEEAKKLADFVAVDLLEAARWILGLSRA